MELINILRGICERPKVICPYQPPYRFECVKNLLLILLALDAIPFATADCSDGKLTTSVLIESTSRTIACPLPKVLHICNAQYGPKDPATRIANPSCISNETSEIKAMCLHNAACLIEPILKLKYPCAGKKPAILVTFVCKHVTTNTILYTDRSKNLSCGNNQVLSIVGVEYEGPAANLPNCGNHSLHVISRVFVTSSCQGLRTCSLQLQNSGLRCMAPGSKLIVEYICESENTLHTPWETPVAPCNAGYSGIFCNKTCINTYGPNCVHNCSETCKLVEKGNKCDIANGSCTRGCYPGYTGAFCDKICPNGTYGESCGEECSPNCNGTTCKPVTGACLDGCIYGYAGFRCDRLPLVKARWFSLQFLVICSLIGIGSMGLLLFAMCRSASTNKGENQEAEIGREGTVVYSDFYIAETEYSEKQSLEQSLGIVASTIFGSSTDLEDYIQERFNSHDQGAYWQVDSLRFVPSDYAISEDGSYKTYASGSAIQHEGEWNRHPNWNQYQGPRVDDSKSKLEEKAPKDNLKTDVENRGKAKKHRIKSFKINSSKFGRAYR